jgi:hypothetical protein
MASSAAHVGTEAREARAHEAAGVVLGVGEERGDLLAERVVELREEVLALLLGGLLDHVGRVVGRHEPHPRAALGRGRGEDQLGLVARGERQEEILGLGVRQDAQPLEPLLGREHGPRLLQLARRQGPIADLRRIEGRHGRAPPARNARGPAPCADELGTSKPSPRAYALGVPARISSDGGCRRYSYPARG